MAYFLTISALIFRLLNKLNKVTGSQGAMQNSLARFAKNGKYSGMQDKRNKLSQGIGNSKIILSNYM